MKANLQHLRVLIWTSLCLWLGFNLKRDNLSKSDSRHSGLGLRSATGLGDGHSSFHDKVECTRRAGISVQVRTHDIDSAFVSPLDAIQELNPTRRPSEHFLLICAGFGHTGTRSLEEALKLMGMRTAHWSTDIKGMVYSGSHELANSSFARFDHVDAVIDIPVPEFFMEMMLSYPRSKVLLTVRNPRKWMQRHVNRTTNGQLAACHKKLNPRQANIRTIVLGAACPSPMQMLKRYLLHNRAVVSVVPPDKLEVLDIFNDPDPFAVLARATGRPHPGVPFPHVGRKSGAVHF